MTGGQNKQGFTIVELLIVIVVLAVLAAITIVAFNNVQARARDAARLSDARAIVKALELYKTRNGSYPGWTAANTTIAASCAGHTNGYAYSDATDNTWIRDLVTGNIVSKVPTGPGNDCNSYMRYLSPGATSYNCPGRTKNYYILEVVGVEVTGTPSGASDPSGGGNWTPCTGATAGWGAGSGTWVFTADE